MASKRTIKLEWTSLNVLLPNDQGMHIPSILKENGASSANRQMGR